MTTEVTPATYTVQEVAAMLGWTTAQVYRHTRIDPDFPCIRTGRTVIYPRRRFDAWLNGGFTPSSVDVVTSPLTH